MSKSKFQKPLWFYRDKYTADLKNTTRVKLLIWKSIDSLFFKTTPSILNFWRIFLLRMCGAKIGKGCYIGPKVTILMPWNLVMGNHSSLDDYCYVKNTTPIVFADFVSVGVFCHFVPDGHDVTTRNFASIRKSIFVDNGVFIGADSYIGMGVRIGEFSVVGQKSMVLKSIPSNSIAYGSPAQVVRKRIPEDVFVKYRFSL